MIGLNKENIPYFTFYSTPIKGDSAVSFLNKIEDGRLYYLKFKNSNLDDSIIQEGTKLFNYISPLEDLENLNQEISDKSLIHNIEDLNTINREQNDYFAKTDGVLIIYNQLVKFIPVCYDGFCEIGISEDKNIATLNIYPSTKNGKQITEDDILKKIRKNNINISLILPEIKNALRSVSQTNIPYYKVVIAKGKEPKLGKEAWVEYLFNTSKKLGPVIEENGHIDFYKVNSLESVTKNQKIAIFHPMVEGKDGFNVFGEKVSPPKLKDTKPPIGQNYYYSETKPNHILSKIDGYITLVAGNIVITNLYNIRGDVDFHTGHIITKGSLNVIGNVKSGFNLNMSENIKIGGYVKDSIINAGGTVFVGGGFSGTGGGKIVSGGDVNVRYIRNQVIYSRGSILVHKEVVEAKLFAKNDIKSQSNDMLIIGGSALAGGDISVNQLGNEYGMKTIIEAGYDYDILSKIKELNDIFELQNKELTELKSKIEFSLANANIRSQRLAKANLINYQTKKKNYNLLYNDKNLLQNNITNPSKSKIIVSGKIYPGVEIIINSRHLEITELMSAKIFSVSPDEENIIITNK